LDVGKENKKRIILKVGETVHRRLLDGDIVFLNRPPSTDKHSVQALYVHIHTDHTIKINPLICGPLGADFDGDCVHIFFPRSVSARAEAAELFTVEKQLVSSHNGKLNFQLKNDCLLAVKKLSDGEYTRREANNLINAMFAGGMIPKKRLSGGPNWSFAQILETFLPDGDKMLVRDLITGTVTLSSILSTKNPREAIEFLNLLQPLLMESLFTDGFSISLRDFDVTNPIPKTVQNSSLDIGKFRKPIVDFITCSSDLSLLVDPKSDSAMNKVVEQIGFLGHQLQCDGRLYSSSLVEDCLSKSESRSSSTDGFIRSSFYNGLNPYEDLLHSISAREKIIRASKGLVEPGNLFKNMMAMLRDVVACYDGTIRNLCGNSVVQFDTGNWSSTVTPGDSVGILAATAVANAAYKAVLDPNPTNMTSWDSMKVSGLFDQLHLRLQFTFFTLLFDIFAGSTTYQG
jgi:DNA-directed RNA polymerase-5 subunit 1